MTIFWHVLGLSANIASSLGSALVAWHRVFERGLLTPHIRRKDDSNTQVWRVSTTTQTSENQRLKLG